MRSAAVAGLALTMTAMAGAQAAPQVQTPRYQGAFGSPTVLMPKLPAPTPYGADASVVEFVVARVNDNVINHSDVVKAQQLAMQQIQEEHLGPAQVAEMQKDMLRDMIDQQLLISKAKELEINVDTDVVKELDSIRKANHKETMEDLERAVAETGMSIEDLKSQIRNKLLIQQVMSQEVGARVGRSLTPAQEQAYYDAHKADFVQPEQMGVSEILVATPENATDMQVADAQAKAADLEEQLRAGAKFEDLARKYSSGATAAQGGDLGMYKKGTLGSPFEDQTWGLPVGGVAAPIRTKQGFVILKVTRHDPAGVQPMKDVLPQVEEAVYQVQMQPAIRQYLTKLREEGYIDIAPGYVDSGASPNQTKPIYTTTSLPTPKVKKKPLPKARFDTASAKPVPGGLGTVPTGTTGSTAAATTSANGKVKKPKKIKPVKVRFGQTPDATLGAGPEEVSSDAGAVAPGTARLRAGQR